MDTEIMHAEVIAIGDELTSGARLDTNSQWLSQQLALLGLRVLYHTTVGDDLAANVDVFRHAAARADIVVCTGGLGPTADDLTRHALAEAAGVELVLDEPSLQHIQRLFARRQRPMPPANTVQAMFPHGSRVVRNPHGTAPGIDLQLPRGNGQSARIFALPGVPAEMHEMWHESVAPAILETIGGVPRVIRKREIKCFGIGESDLEQMLPDLIRRGQSPTVGITVSRATITLRVVAEADSPQECDAQIEPVVETIRRCLGDLVFGEGDDELQHAVVRLLAEQQKTLATAEYGSGGLLASWLSAADPSARHYRGGYVLRDGAQAESDEQLVELARDCQQRYHTQIGLALGRFPHPSSPAEAPRVYFAVALGNQTHVHSAPYSGHPDILAARSTKSALNFLRLTLLGTTF